MNITLLFYKLAMSHVRRVLDLEARIENEIGFVNTPESNAAVTHSRVNRVPYGAVTAFLN